MARKKGSKNKPKFQTNQTQPQSPLNVNASDLSNEVNSAETSLISDEVSLNVEANTSETEKEEKGFLTKALELAQGFGGDDVVEDKKQRKNKKSPDEFNALVVAFVTLATSLTIPEKIRPVDNEISIFSNHLAGILSRHLNISGKLSADALDIIGLITCVSMYYVRISPELKTRQAKKEIPTQTETPEDKNDNAPEVSRYVPLETKAFLEKAEQDAIKNANNKNI